MEDMRRVEVLEAAQELVHEVLDVLVRQPLIRRDDALEVALVQLRHEVQRVEILRVPRRRHDIEDLRARGGGGGGR